MLIRVKDKKESTFGMEEPGGKMTVKNDSKNAVIYVRVGRYKKNGRK